MAHHKNGHSNSGINTSAAGVCTHLTVSSALAESQNLILSTLSGTDVIPRQTSRDETSASSLECADKSLISPNTFTKGQTNGRIPEVVSGDCDSDHEKVTMRKKRKKTTFQDAEEIISAEHYKYLDLVQGPKTCSSRKLVEMGSEKMISDDDLRLAATLVSDAMEGWNAAIKTEPNFVRSYNMFKSWPLTYLLYLALMVDLSLVVFEKPAVQGFAIDYRITISVEFVCLTYFAIRTVHNFHWRPATKFIRDYKNIFIIVILMITVIDMLVYLFMMAFDQEDNTRRVSRVFRPLFIVNFSDGRQIRRAWRNMRRTIMEIVHVLFLFIFFILVFAVIAVQIFSSRTDIVYPDGRPYFKNYMYSVWDLYILVTTSNNPDVMMPAVDKSRFYCIFFFIYILVCFYMLLNVFLAVAYHSYSKNMKLEIKRRSREKKKKLDQAFNVIKTNYNGEDMVTYKIWKRLMALAQPNLSKNEIDLLMMILDMNCSGHIGRREFMNVADLLNVPLSEVGDRKTWLEKMCPAVYNSVPSEYVKAFVSSVIFKLLYDAVVTTEVFLIAFNTWNVDIPFCSLYTLEILLKLYTFGPQRFAQRFENWFDTLITATSIVMISLDLTFQAPVVHETTESVKIIRIFRILRLLIHFKRFKIILDTLINISLSIFMYCGILFIVFYIFAIIGMEIFQGKITNYGYNTNVTTQMYCGAPEIANSSFYESRYCNLNFNDVVGAVLVLATVLFENNWHVLAEGYTLVSGKIAMVYFSVFFLCACMVIMNIVTAFVVDMFMHEYKMQSEDKVDTPVEKKIKELGLGIDADTGLEISAPISDQEMENIMKKSGIQKPRQHPWIEKAALKGIRTAEIRFSRFNSYVNRRKSSMPSLNRFDGIRFHIKKKGWRKVEVLLEQLYDVESDDDVDAPVNNTNDSTKPNKQNLVTV